MFIYVLRYPDDRAEEMDWIERIFSIVGTIYLMPIYFLSMVAIAIGTCMHISYSAHSTTWSILPTELLMHYDIPGFPERCDQGVVISIDYGSQVPPSGACHGLIIGMWL